MIQKSKNFRFKKLQNKDQYHNVFVGEVGYYKQNPSHSYIDDIDGEYLNKDLNTLMKKYQENQDHKNLHFEEMLKEKTSKTASTEEISQAINDKDDPWLKKVSDSDNKSDSESEQKLEIKENLIFHSFKLFIKSSHSFFISSSLLYFSNISKDKILY